MLFATSIAEIIYGYYEMSLSNRKFLVFLLILAMFSLATATFASSFENSSKDGLKFPWQQSESDPNFPSGISGKDSTSELYVKMALMVLFVVCFGAAAMYLSKKLLPRFTNLPGKRIKVIETVHLGQRRSIHLLKIGEQEILIGSTNETISKLADITDYSFEVDLPKEE